MTTPPVAAIKIRLLFQNIKFSWNPNPKPFNKFDIETQAFFEDTVFPYKRPSQSSLDCSKPSTTTTTPKIRFFIESPRTPPTPTPFTTWQPFTLWRPPSSSTPSVEPHGKRITPVYIAIIVDNDTKVTIQNNIFYPLDLEEHLLQLQHGDPWSTWWPVITFNMDIAHGPSPFDDRLSDF